MPRKIVIVGAGIAGLTAGILLKKQFGQDVNITLYEQRDSIKSIGGALSIWPNGAKILLNLPCARDIQALAGDLIKEHWGSAKGDTLRILDRNALLQINGYPFMNICRSELQELLLKNFGKDNVIFGSKIIDIKHSDKDTILYFSNGSHTRADLVIGADGTFSTIRRIIFPNAEVEYTGYVALVGICQFLKKEQPQHHVIWGKNHLLVTFPISAGRHMVYTIAPLPKGVLKNTLTTREQQLKLFYGWSSEVDKILTVLTHSLSDPKYANHYYCSENYDRPLLSAFHHKNVVLIGDAAHPMGSIIGLNTNAALEDANKLAHLLKNENHIEIALRRFSIEQTHRIASMINMENNKKKFLLGATDETYSDFLQFVHKVSEEEFLNPLFTMFCQPSPQSTSLIQQALPSLKSDKISEEKSVQISQLRSSEILSNQVVSDITSALTVDPEIIGRSLRI